MSKQFIPRVLGKYEFNLEPTSDEAHELNRQKVYHYWNNEISGCSINPYMDHSTNEWEETKMGEDALDHFNIPSDSYEHIEKMFEYAVDFTKQFKTK